MNYNPNIGGSIVPHKLCEYINEYTDAECFLYRYYNYPIFRNGKVLKGIMGLLLVLLRRLLLKIKSTDKNKNSLLKRIPKNINDYVVVYLEGARDNPLNAQKVVRLILHNPGHFTGMVHYNTNELYFMYADHFKRFSFFGSKTSDKLVHISHYPIELYNKNGVSNRRKGTCYAMRKGRNRKIVHNLKDSILIDELSHEEISKIFKQSKAFISYDLNTAYSKLAAVCGCLSIVVPDENITKDEWQPIEKLRYGIAYGFSAKEIEWAQSTQHKVMQTIIEGHEENIAIANNFVDEINDYFY